MAADTLVADTSAADMVADTSAADMVADTLAADTLAADSLAADSLAADSLAAVFHHLTLTGQIDYPFISPLQKYILFVSFLINIIGNFIIYCIYMSNNHIYAFYLQNARIHS